MRCLPSSITDAARARARRSRASCNTCISEEMGDGQGREREWTWVVWGVVWEGSARCRRPIVGSGWCVGDSQKPPIAPQHIGSDPRLLTKSPILKRVMVQ